MSTTMTSFYWSYDKGRMPLNAHYLPKSIPSVRGAVCFYFLSYFKRCSIVSDINIKLFLPIYYFIFINKQNQCGQRARRIVFKKLKGGGVAEILTSQKVNKLKIKPKHVSAETPLIKASYLFFLFIKTIRKNLSQFKIIFQVSF